MFRALSTIDLVVNGKVIVHQPMPAGFRLTVIPLAAGALKAFRFEQNDVDVRVHKRATRGRCNTGAPATQLGVQFMLRGHFGTDLALNPPPPDSFYKLAPNQTFTQGVHVHFRNDGPGWEPNGRFQLNVDGVKQFLLGSSSTASVPAPGPPLTDCKQTDNGLSHVVTCGLSNFAPGTAGVLGVIFQVQAPPGDYSDFHVALSWYIGAGGVQDSNTSNNLSHATIVFCGSKSTNPGCQTAS